MTYFVDHHIFSNLQLLSFSHLQINYITWILNSTIWLIIACLLIYIYIYIYIYIFFFFFFFILFAILYAIDNECDIKYRKRYAIAKLYFYIISNKFFFHLPLYNKLVITLTVTKFCPYKMTHSIDISILELSISEPVLSERGWEVPPPHLLFYRKKSICEMQCGGGNFHPRSESIDSEHILITILALPARFYVYIYIIL